MDTSKAVTHVGLCAGYGGIELGLKRAIPNLRSIALCEVEAFAIANLVAKMEAGCVEPAPIWPNLKTFPWESFRGCVDILTGGYPCQPFSAAGKRQGADDPRHLWPYIARGIRILQPRLCFFENVEGHISLGLSDVIEDLAGMGYRTTWGIFSASEVGAPHQRKRVFILAVSSGFRGAAGLSGSFQRHEGQSGESDDGGGEAAWPSRPGEQQYGWEPPRVVLAHSSNNGCASGEAGGDVCGEQSDTRRQKESASVEQSAGSDSFASLSGAAMADIRQTQPTLGGDTDGSTGGLDYAELCVTCDNRTDELRLLGNGVVPATSELAYRTLARELLQIPS